MLIVKKMSIPGRQPGVPLRHQPSPGGFLLKGGVIGPPGSAGVPPASETCRRFRPRLRARAQTTNILYTINRKQGLHPAKQWDKEPCAGLKNHSPLEGESARPGRSPQSSRWGASLVICGDYQHGWTGNTGLGFRSPAVCNPAYRFNGLLTWMHRMHRIFSGNGWLVFLSIRNPAHDHCRSRLLVQ